MLTSGEETATQFVGTNSFGWELCDHILAEEDQAESLGILSAAPVRS
jgi:hypothetical protein